ncbi:MAG: hypothetical protein ACR5LA_02455 [Wolbachia sp.]
MLSVIADFASNTKAVPRHWNPAFDRKCCIVRLFTINFSGSLCQLLG